MKIARVIRKRRCGVVVDYVLWPETGCSLAEARERTADRELFSQSAEASKGNVRTETKPVEERINADCLDHLKGGRLIAYGRPGGSTAGRQLITTAQWKSFTSIGWQDSSATDCELRTFDICVYPPLLAPCHIDLLAGSALADAFMQLVLNEPEVASLGREAVRRSPEFEAVFIRGHCQLARHHAQWPLTFERWPMASTVHPDPTKRSKSDFAREPNPLEVVIATEALKHRYGALISILRRGDLEGRGLTERSGDLDVIPRSIWSHLNFYLDGCGGDILQDGQKSVCRYHILVRRWSGVVLHRPDPSAHVFRAMFHGKPPVYDQSLSPPQEPQQAPPSQSKAVARVETKTTSFHACEAWLKAIISKSPNQRTHSNEELWAQAEKKWPQTLSHRKFDEARAAAISSTPGASAWAVGGRPKKAAAPKSPH